MNLKDLRKKHGMTQHELAIESGVSQQVISWIEVNGYQNQKLNTISNLAKTFGMSIDELVGAKSVIGVTPLPKQLEMNEVEPDRADMLEEMRKEF